LLNRPYILIVDDDIALLQALPQTLFLRMQEIEVDTSDSAFEALNLIQEHDYDAIVSDIKMPGMDGLALLTKIQELRPQTPVLLITGHGEHNFAIQALRGGAYDFIQKPLDRDYVVASLSRAIQMHQLQRQVEEQQRVLERHAHLLEQTVQERTRELIEANAVKDEFLSIASHELKTPLASLKGMTQLLRRRLDRSGSPEVTSAKRMERSIRRMELLVNDLLDASLMATGIFNLHCERCNLNRLCQDLIDEFTMGIEPAPVITLHVRNQPLEADVDIDRISQVILNLLSNARKYSPAGTPISLMLQQREDKATIAVSDKGIGIPAELIPHMFERFYRVPGVEVKTGSSFGLGLGLYISHKIVECHGGCITVQSTSGHGSTFSISLPLAADPVAIDTNRVEAEQQR
jgi:two-component system, sensor histidine kinase and response regulator